MKFLKPKIEFSKIEKIFDFTQNDWKNNQKIQRLHGNVILLSNDLMLNAEDANIYFESFTKIFGLNPPLSKIENKLKNRPRLKVLK